RLALHQVSEQHPLRQRDDKRPGKEVAAAHAIAVDERQRREEHHPQRNPEIGPIHRPGAGSACSQEKAERQKGLDLAREIARHDRGGLQRPAGAVDHPQANRRLPGVAPRQASSKPTKYRLRTMKPTNRPSETASRLPLTPIAETNATSSTMIRISQ